MTEKDTTAADVVTRRHMLHLAWRLRNGEAFKLLPVIEADELKQAAAELEAAAGALDAQRQEIERLRDALYKAEAQFAFYAREHRFKAADQTWGVAAATTAKAETNERFAAMCLAALTPSQEAEHG